MVLKQLLIVAACVLAAGCARKPPFTINGAPAPEINTTYGWLNTDTPYTIKSFRGKMLLLDFWTLGCINCQHVIPDLKKLEDKFGNNLVVIGVHSAKFESEKQTQRIRAAISKFGIDHPVVNDADYTVWNAYGVEAWPTLVLVSPDGKIALKKEGENVYNTFYPEIEKLLKEYDGEIDTRPFVFKQPETDLPASALKFPSKMIVDKDGNIWVSDSGHDRIVKIDQTGKILTIIGKGAQGFDDGDFSTATFNEPQGLALKDGVLFIADAKNNAIRAADLATKQVKTIAGNGKMGYYYNNDKWDVPVLPNSPWDLLVDSNFLYIADAGNHQILRMNIKGNQVFRFAGSGKEGIKDGGPKQSSFSQPSGLTKADSVIYVADPEASAIRKLNPANGVVETIIGKGLFDFGDKDGNAKDAQLQHCVGLAANQGNLYIADTYNGKVKLFNTKTNTVTTLVTGLNEPNAILVINNVLWIADTNNNQLVKFKLSDKTKEIVQIKP